MARSTKLTDTKLRNLKPQERDYRVSDEDGLYIQVTSKGSKLWRFRYYYNRKEKMLAFGKYPAVSLADARKARDDARAEIAAGRDPSLTRKKLRARASQATDTFHAVSEEWLKRNSARWSERYTHTVRRWMERFIWPSLGQIPLSEITPPMVLQICQNIEGGEYKQGAHKARRAMSGVFCYGMAVGLTSNDPAAQIKPVLMPASGQKHFPALLDIAELREMLSDVETLPGRPIPKLAFRMLALTSCRSAELRGMRWGEVDLEQGLWHIPAARMKMKRPHTVYLPRQAVELIEFCRPFSGMCDLVFTGESGDGRPLTGTTLSRRIKLTRFADRHVPHGFRASFSSVMNEQFPEYRAIIDQMLAHESRGTVESAYNRAEHPEIKKKIAQRWADLLLEGAVTLPELVMGPRK